MGLFSELTIMDQIIVVIIFAMLGGLVWMVEYLKRDADAILAQKKAKQKQQSKKAQ